MKKTGILNAEISAIVAQMGHTDTLVVADAGLPIPSGPRRIDLALKPGVPGFLETVAVILDELQVESVTIAEEMTQVSPELYKALLELLGDIPVQQVSHVMFKEMTREARAVVRTGEFTPYANIILSAGVVF